MEAISAPNEILPGLGAPAAKPKSDNNLGQTDFLQLLVAQLENQDPAKPMDNFEFLSQIAQFGMVDGIQQLQGSFTDVADSVKQGQMMQAASLLGREVLSGSNLGLLDANRQVNGSVSLPDSASNVMLEISTPGGESLRNIPLGSLSAGSSDFSWDGLDSDGFALPQGEYVVRATGQVDGRAQDFSVDTMSRVDSVTVDTTGQLSLSLRNGREVQVSAVDRFR
jgi:flagellar basal-body rod modification protein FlgD